MPIPDTLLPDTLTVNRLCHNDARHVLHCLRWMKYDDALVIPSARLEYRSPAEGETHYLLERYGQPVGLQYVRAASWLDEVQRKLAVYLANIGFTPQFTRRIAGGAQTPLAFQHNRLPHLFTFDAWHEQKDAPDPDDQYAFMDTLPW